MVLLLEFLVETTEMTDGMICLAIDNYAYTSKLREANQELLRILDENLVWHIEGDKRNIALRNIETIPKALKISISELIRSL